jgi:hypothetical protein
MDAEKKNVGPLSPSMLDSERADPSLRARVAFRELLRESSVGTAGLEVELLRIWARGGVFTRETHGKAGSLAGDRKTSSRSELSGEVLAI